MERFNALSGFSLSLVCSFNGAALRWSGSTRVIFLCIQGYCTPASMVPLSDGAVQRRTAVDSYRALWASMVPLSDGAVQHRYRFANHLVHAASMVPLSDGAVQQAMRRGMDRQKTASMVPLSDGAVQRKTNQPLSTRSWSFNGAALRWSGSTRKERAFQKLTRASMVPLSDGAVQPRSLIFFCRCLYMLQWCRSQMERFNTADRICTLQHFELQWCRSQMERFNGRHQKAVG